MAQQLGLLGHKISYSLSPAIHNFSAQLLGLDYQYQLYDIKENGIKNFLGEFLQSGGAGLNVTTPHKHTAATLADTNTKSVNTLFLDDQKSWKGASTDGLGFIHGLNHIEKKIDDFDHIVLLGDGGAAYSLLTTFQSSIPTKKTTLYNRKGTASEDFQKLSPALKNNTFLLENSLVKDMVKRSSSNTLVIQATSAPLRGDRLAWLSDSFNGFQGTFVDLVYGTPSDIYLQLKKAGNPCQDGLPMLIEQARLSQKIWWKQSAPYQQILKHLQLNV